MINLQPLQFLIRIVSDPRLLRPSAKIVSPATIDTSAKWKQLMQSGLGVRTEQNVILLIDKDNCWCHPRQNAVYEEYRQSFTAMNESFQNVYWLSNTISLDSQYRDSNQRFEGIEVIPVTAKKPACGEKVEKFLQTRHSDLRQSQVVMMGDRVLTDVLMANDRGWKSILVQKVIDESAEGSGAFIFRKIERWFTS
ncbi:hypothetical protein MIR68_012052 [Amoeboaphelidium protococcarum]|nr:hypothetical protein MIR68_012052 [Amoeboaphelidium protococcarum]